ncbi:MAG: hypothetical protein QXT28_06345 [Thermofilaceae archaeon]
MEVQLVRRTRPRELTYLRSAPVTILEPTPAQAECRLRFAEAAKLAARVTAEEAARLVGGEVVEVAGRKAVRMPDGRLLLPHQAYISALVRGWRSGRRKERLPLWAQRLATAARLLYAPSAAQGERTW